MNKGFIRIGELCRRIGVKPYTLRYWEKEFGDFIRPYRSKGRHRRYREDDLKVLMKIKELIKDKGYTVKGAKKALGIERSTMLEGEKNSLEEGNYFQGKKVLITGGTGTVGRELTRRLLSFSPSVVRIYSRDETKQFEMAEEFRQVENLRFFIGDVRDGKRLEMAMEDVDIVFHLAALKHVASCEYNPFEAINTNVYGSQNVINAALKVNAEKVIFTSTDKAVNPTSTMGATKLMAEKLFTAANYYKGKRRTVFATVRFGNVLGSRGSAVPLFKNQLLKGEKITLTSKKMTRFVMSLKDAVDFIFKASFLTRGGEVFVPKMPVVRIVDLVEAIEEVLGFKNGIKEIGTKPGEKLYEELMTKDEEKRALEREDMYIILPPFKSGDGKYSYPGAFILTDNNHCTSEKGEFLSKEELKKLLEEESLL